MYQAISVAYEADAAVLTLRLTNGAEYRVTNAGHAQAIRQSIMPGGELSEGQCVWLERYRVAETPTDRSRLMKGLKELRAELKPKLKD